MASLGYRDTGASYAVPGCVADLLVWHGAPTLNVVTDEALVGFQGGETGIGKLGCGHLVCEQKRK